MENILDSFCEMQDDLNKEKRSISLMWSKRQQHLESVLLSITRFFGNVKAIAGNSIETPRQLELPEKKEAA